MLAGLIPSVAVRKTASPLASGGLLAIFGVLWFVDVSLQCLMLLPVCMSVSKFTPFMRIPVMLD